MATTRKKKTADKASSRRSASRRRTPKRNQLGTQVGFLGSGVGVVLGWVTAAILILMSALRWVGSIGMDALRGRRGRAVDR